MNIDKLYDKNGNYITNESYVSIKKLYEYCLKIGVDARFEKLFDGYAIRFKNGGNFVQHFGSYGSQVDCVEPAINSRLDYSAVELKNAKLLVKRYKDRLNKEIKGA